MSYSLNCGVAEYQDCICVHIQLSNFLGGLPTTQEHPPLVMYIDETMDWLEIMVQLEAIDSTLSHLHRKVFH